MRLLFQLLRLRFLTPRSLLLLYRAKKKHGNNLCFLLNFSADYYGGKPAISNGTHQLNFKQLYEAVLNLSFTIHKKINPSKRTVVILICNNTINDIVTLYAIQNLGLTLILANNKLHHTEILKIKDKQQQLCYIFSSTLTELPIEGIINIDDLIADSGKENKKELLSKDCSGLIFSTSGTTGEAKLVEKRTGEFYWLQSFADLIKRTSIDKRKSVYISIPISHGFGYTAILFTLILGKKAVLSDSKHENITNLLLQEEVDLLVGVPTTLYKVAEKLEGTDHCIQSIISGGAPLNETIFNKLTKVLSKKIFSMYGSTEASVSFIANYEELSKNICALGNPLLGVKYRLEPLANGEKELLIQSTLSNVSTLSGWIHTGDIAMQDAIGNLIWCSRKDSMIIKGGVNIYPIEIEIALLRITAIEDVYVLGEKDQLKGEIIIAFIKMKSNTIFNETDIKEDLKLVLSGSKIPDKIYQINDFEYTSTGKKVKPTPEKLAK